MWLNPQTWSVISGLATEEQAKKALDSVYRELNTKYGARVMAPSYVDHAFDGALPYCLILQPKKTEVYSHSHRAGLYLQNLLWDTVTVHLNTLWRRVRQQ